MRTVIFLLGMRITRVWMASINATDRTDIKKTHDLLFLVFLIMDTADIFAKFL